VVCVIFDSQDEVAGVNSVYQDTAPLIQRRFWIYRRFARPSIPLEVETEMLKAAFDELARRFAETAEGPVGVCVLVSDPDVIEGQRDAVWTSGFVYAGYTEAGAQVRVRYFVGAGI
jgi:hypothetical protein